MLFAFLLPAVLPYGPWKPDEPYIFGLVNQVLQSGDAVVLMLGNEPFVEKPPLMMWTAALTARLLSPWLDLEHGARFAIPLYLALTFAATAFAARQWFGVGHGRYAVLGMMAVIGMVQQGRLLVPDIPQLAGFAVSLAGLSLLPRWIRLGGALLGTGVGLAFLSKGLLGPGIIGVVSLLLPVLAPQWRNVAYAKALAVALLASLPWLVIWPTELYWSSPSLFTEWFWENNIGRFLGFSVARLGASNDSTQLVSTVPWFTFPLAPLALLTLWQRRHKVRSDNGLLICSLSLAIMTLTFAVSRSGREIYLLPMTIPLAMLAIPAVHSLSLRLNTLGDWAARGLFASLVALGWYLWVTAFVLASPPQWTWLARQLPLDVDLPVHPLAAVVAAAILIGWVWSWRIFAALNARAMVSWASGLVVFWATAFVLLFPWLDSARGYQDTFARLAKALPADSQTCLASAALGESEHGMLDYMVPMPHLRIELNPSHSCRYLLWQSRGELPKVDMTKWREVWQGARPGEQRERFWLYERDASATVVATGFPSALP